MSTLLGTGRCVCDLDAKLILTPPPNSPLHEATQVIRKQKRSIGCLYVGLVWGLASMFVFGGAVMYLTIRYQNCELGRCMAGWSRDNDTCFKAGYLNGTCGEAAIKCQVLKTQMVKAKDLFTITPHLRQDNSTAWNVDSRPCDQSSDSLLLPSFACAYRTSYILE